MTRALLAPAPTRAAALTFDEKLALSPLAMDARLDFAGLTFDVNTASIPAEAPEILSAPALASAPQPVTVDDVLREARRLIAAHGWIRQYVGRAETGYCLIGAIRKAAGGNRALEDAAEGLMLERIRAQFPEAISVGQWNDSQAGPTPVLRMLG
ncbi:DUF6197 family protein [Streptomyces sp. NPDC054956]